MKAWREEHLKKVVPPEEIAALVEKLKSEKQTIVTVNGSFDLLHAGHLHQLYEGSQLGDVLVVALNTDASIQKYKSPLRPIIPLMYRLQMIAALSFVDYVTYFEETDPRKLLTIIKPDVHVNGAEYGQECIEAEVIKQCGGKLHLVSKIDGLSTTQIIEKIGSVCVY